MLLVRLLFFFYQTRVLQEILITQYPIGKATDRAMRGENSLIRIHQMDKQSNSSYSLTVVDEFFQNQLQRLFFLIIPKNHNLLLMISKNKSYFTKEKKISSAVVVIVGFRFYRSNISPNKYITSQNFLKREISLKTISIIEKKYLIQLRKLELPHLVIDCSNPIIT